MKKVARVVAFVLAAVLTVPAFASDGKQDEVTALLEAGFSQNFLECRSNAEIEELYTLLQTVDVLYEESVVYLDSEEETSTCGTIPTSDMRLRVGFATILGADENGRRQIETIMVFVDYEWFEGHPSITKVDGITVNWDSDLFSMVPGSFSSADYHNYGNGAVELTVNEQTNPLKLDQGGLGYEVTLTPMQGLSSYVCVVSGSASFDLVPRSPIYYDDNGNTHNASINVQYVHDKNPLPGFSLSFSYQGVGVTIDPGMFQDSVAINRLVEYSV